MKRLLLLIALVAFTGCTKDSPTQAPPPPTTLTGSWEGKLLDGVPGTYMNVTLTLVNNSGNGEYTLYEEFQLQEIGPVTLRVIGTPDDFQLTMTDFSGSIPFKGHQDALGKLCLTLTGFPESCLFPKTTGKTQNPGLVASKKQPSGIARLRFNDTISKVTTENEQLPNRNHLRIRK